ncbi:MAG: DNA primase [Clostridiales bacterium]|nr:DNA primase [Clostridiales bacterium]
MAFPESFLQELTARSEITDVVSQYVKLTKRSGANLFGLCPFHSEKTPSFSVSPEKQIYHCFGCGKGGGVINFIMEIENLSYPDAVRFLAKRANLEIPESAPDENRHRRERMLELNRDAARFFHDCLMAPGGEIARRYVDRRKIGGAMVTRFGLGFAPDSWDSLVNAMRDRGYTNAELHDAGLARVSKKGGGIYDTFRNRLMFPVIDVRGSVIGFSGRILDEGEPKYMNSPETLVFNKSRNLFAMNLAKKSKKGYIILSEGNIDVVALHQAGFDCAVASLGTSLTPEQARLLSNYTREVVIAYDFDAAGQKASQRAIGILEQLDIRVRVLRMEGAKDPDEFIKAFGAPAFENLVMRSENHIEYLLSDAASKYDLTVDESRVAFLKDAVALIANLPGAVAREVYSMKAAEMAGVSGEAVHSEVDHLRKRKLSAEKKKLEAEVSRPVRTNQPRVRSLRYENIRSAKAEEGLIRLLFADPSLLSSDQVLDQDDFSSEVLGRCFAELTRQIRSGGTPSLPMMAELFTGDEMSLLTGIIAEPQDMANSEKALDDYIEIIKMEKLTAKRGENSAAELNELAEKLRKSKGYGRKKDGGKG